MKLYVKFAYQKGRSFDTKDSARLWENQGNQGKSGNSKADQGKSDRNIFMGQIHFHKKLKQGYHLV